MVDTRLPDRWLTAPRYISLSDTAWRCFTTALMWCNTHLTDSHIPAPALRVIGFSGRPEVVDELLPTGHRDAVEGGFMCVGDWESDLGHSSAQNILDYREKARLRQAKKRGKDTVTGDNPSDVGKERTGKERLGEAELAKLFTKCRAKTSSWSTDLAPVLCIRCETDENPL
jgi:hypothetical protein